MAVTNQPGRYEPSDFQTGLWEFCDDCGTCLYGLFCYPCLGCSIASDMDECCLCGLSMPIRSVYRTRYNIKAVAEEAIRSFTQGKVPIQQSKSTPLQGSLCKDFMAVWCCPICATCQLKRDIDRRKEQGIF